MEKNLQYLRIPICHSPHAFDQKIEFLKETTFQ